MNDDLKELLASLKSHGVKFLVIGGHAVSFYSRPRMTEDVDVWVGREKGNVARLGLALEEFGAPIGKEGEARFAELDRQMLRLGVPPAMADIMNFAGDRPFEEAWQRRVPGLLDGIEVDFPAKQDLIDMKRGVGRPQDLADIRSLEGS
jgi:hypothetical protein